MSARPDGDPNTSATVLVGVIGSVLLVAILIGMQALFYHVRDEEEAQKYFGEPSQELVSLRAAQLEALNSYRWIDQQRGVVAIPIERAMELTWQELRMQPSGASGGQPGVGGAGGSTPAGPGSSEIGSSSSGVKEEKGQEKGPEKGYEKAPGEAHP